MKSISQELHIPYDILAIILVGIVHFSYFPFYPYMHSANEWSRLYLVYAIVDDGDIEITSQIEKFGDILDKSRVGHSFFSDKPPGTAFISVPFIALRRVLGGEPDIGKDIRIARLVTCILPTLALLFLLNKEMKGLKVSSPTRGFAITIYGLGSLAFPYSLLFYGHQPTAVLLFAIYYCIHDKEVNPKKGYIAGFLAGLCLMMEYQSAVYILPLAFVGIMRAKPRIKTLLFTITGSSLPLLALGLYHNVAFGSPFSTGYNYIDNTFFANVHRQGFMGVSYPKITNFVGSLFLPSKGLFFFSPILLLGFLGIRAYWIPTNDRMLGVLRIIMILLPILFVSSMVYWDGGWTVSQRHLTPLCPFLIAPLACFIERHGIAKVVSPFMGFSSVMMVGIATIVYPHLPESIPNPFHDISIPLLKKGCISNTIFEPIISAKSLSILFGFLLISLWIGIITSWKIRMSLKSISVIAMALIPIIWFHFTGKVSRLKPEEQTSEISYFENQCIKANRIKREESSLPILPRNTQIKLLRMINP